MKTTLSDNSLKSLRHQLLLKGPRNQSADFNPQGSQLPAHSGRICFRISTEHTPTSRFLQDLKSQSAPTRGLGFSVGGTLHSGTLLKNLLETLLLVTNKKEGLQLKAPGKVHLEGAEVDVALGVEP